MAKIRKFFADKNPFSPINMAKRETRKAGKKVKKFGKEIGERRKEERGY